jgi:hypothetical protein
VLVPDSLLLRGLLAYGPAPGVELIPYFLGLLTWVGLAFAAILLSPITALLRRLRRDKGAPQAEGRSEPMPAAARESRGGDDNVTR